MFRRTYGGKYGAKKTDYNGRKYDSKFEAKIAYELDMRLKSGEFVEIVPQYPIQLYVYLPNSEKANLFKYICDFRCEKKDGTYLLVEAKGYRTDIYRTKAKILDLIWLPDHPEYEFEEVSQG